MKITMYELLGMIKDGKAPKKIRYLDKIFNYNKLHADYVFIETYGEATDTREYLTDWIGLSKDGLNDEVEILEEEKKIPEKIPEEIIVGKKQPVHRIKKIEKKINEVIDYLDYLKSKGE